ncbi:MAG: FG-GAP-like repeat-containing protein [Melioribacteraceae bacterium]|nr:FG-GAP-like repeat-containing protein [Melioribacteraceae bacterium]MCF8264064.1 FG-GAP-like repeat-containing protein [Melioribacteraceae bacterium]MCF8430833.1 FG-GAP-like repeat-containing protein [Melioribacteraceae bacterium]
MKKTLISIFVFFLLLSSTTRAQFYDWQLIAKTNIHQGQFIYPISSNNIWIRNIKGETAFFSDDKVEFFASPVDESSSYIQIQRLNKNVLMLVGTDTTWRTHVYRFKDRKWEKQSKVFDIPLTKVIHVKDNLIYAPANFGRFFVFDNSDWTEIESPTKSHFTTHYLENENDLWLATKYDGVFHFDGKQIRKIDFADPLGGDIAGIHNLDSTILVVDAKQNEYKFNGVRFVKTYAKKVESHKLYRRNEVGITSLSKDFYRKEINLYQNFNISNIANLDSSRIIILTTTGELYLSSEKSHNSFYELAEKFGLEGAIGVSNLGVIVLDYNNDNFDDLVLNNSYNYAYFELFSNNNNSPFSSNQIYDSKNAYILPKMIGCDFNNEGMSKIIFSKFDSLGVTIKSLRIAPQQKAPAIELFRIPDNYAKQNPSNLNSVDIDADGDPDICVSYYYGPNGEKGAELIYFNNYWGLDFKLDTSFTKITSGWNVKSLFADFDNDGDLDWYIANKWRTNKLLIWNGDFFQDESESRFNNPQKTECFAACAFDFDNDGDLDLVTASDNYFIQLFENNGTGFFRDISDSVGFRIPRFRGDLYMDINISIADYNNDGFSDLFLSTNRNGMLENLLMLNIDGNRFEDFTKAFNLDDPFVNNIVSFDADGDGDIDIFGTTSAKNKLWINNLDNKNYLKFSRGNDATSQLINGCKISLFENIPGENSNKLIAYKQLGTENSGRANANYSTIHFGLGDAISVNALIEFTDGSKMELNSLDAGKLVILPNNNSITTSAYNFFGMLVKNILTLNFVFTLLSFLLTALVISLGIKHGADKFDWDYKLIAGLVAVNLSLFWVIYLLNLNSKSDFAIFVLPFILSSIGIIIPNLFFVWIAKNPLIFDKNRSDELLTILLQFTHGEWALRNINSLILLTENVTPQLCRDDDFIQKLLKRAKTYNELTSPNIEKLLKILLKIKEHNSAANTLNDANIFATTSISNFSNSFDPALDFSTLSKSLKIIKDKLAEIKESVFLQNSCSPIDIIQKLIENSGEHLASNFIKVKFRSELRENHDVLIKEIELANIIDNLFANSIKALATTQNKIINILIYRYSPKTIIEFSDTGIGISKNDREKIFDLGFSRFQSSGSGLYNSREILKKYNGNIFLKESIENNQTTFQIELMDI